jgi:peptidoglycan hydrolase CwlO-like protein
MKEDIDSLLRDVADDLKKLREKLTNPKKHQEELISLAEEMASNLQGLQKNLDSTQDAILAAAVEDFAKWRDVEALKFGLEAQKEITKETWRKIDERLRTIYGISLPRPIWET